MWLRRVRLVWQAWCDSADPWPLLLLPVCPEHWHFYPEGLQSLCSTHVILFTHVWTPVLFFHSWMPGNLFSDYHMKWAVGLNAAASYCSGNILEDFYYMIRTLFWILLKFRPHWWLPQSLWHLLVKYIFVVSVSITMIHSFIEISSIAVGYHCSEQWHNHYLAYGELAQI